MDKERAKSFLFHDRDNNKIYISKDLDKLMEMNDNCLIDIFAIVDTESGEKLFEMDFAYSGEPIIMRVFLHLCYYLDAYCGCELVNLDE